MPGMSDINVVASLPGLDNKSRPLIAYVWFLQGPGCEKSNLSSHYNAEPDVFWPVAVAVNVVFAAPVAVAFLADRLILYYERGEAGNLRLKRVKCDDYQEWNMTSLHASGPRDGPSQRFTDWQVTSVARLVVEDRSISDASKSLNLADFPCCLTNGMGNDKDSPVMVSKNE